MQLTLTDFPNEVLSNAPYTHLINADCFDVFPHIPDGSVDLILADLPYNTTNNKWEYKIPLDWLWINYKRIIKSNGAIVLTAAQPFTTQLVMSNHSWFRYDLVWQKTHTTSFLNAKKMPLRNHEDILVFYNSLPTYNPQKTTGHPRKVSTASHRRNSKKGETYGQYGLTSYDSTERYPKSVLQFASDKQKSALHTAQKPVALFEYLIKTYTNEGDLVLDNTAGVFTTCLAAYNTGRRSIGIEKEPEYYQKGLGRFAHVNDLQVCNQ